MKVPTTRISERPPNLNPGRLVSKKKRTIRKGMTSIENQYVPNSEEEISLEENEIANSQSNLESSIRAMAVTSSAEESWIQQSLAIPSATSDASLPDASSDCDLNSTQASARNEKNTTGTSHHRREGSLESFSGLFGPEQTQWAAHASALFEQTICNDSGIPAVPTTGNSSITGNASSPYLNINSWGGSSFGNADSGLDPLTFTTSFSSTEEDTSGIPSDIHDAARIFNWKMVGELCETKPEAAAYIGEDGWTVSALRYASSAFQYHFTNMVLLPTFHHRRCIMHVIVDAPIQKLWNP